MTAEILNHNIFNSNKMIVVPVKEGENIEKALKKFKRKFEKTGIVKELRSRQATGTLENPARIPELRKDVARLKTILNSRKIEN